MPGATEICVPRETGCDTNENENKKLLISACSSRSPTRRQPTQHGVNVASD